MTSRARSRSLPLSLQRRWIVDLMHFSQRVPTVGGERTILVDAASAARRALERPPSWSALIAKAYALVATRRGELRRVFMPLPWPHLYEHSTSVATIVTEREWNGEEGVFFDQLPAPEAQPIAQISNELLRLAAMPVESIGGYRRLIRFTRWPWPFRRLAWTFGLKTSGYLRARYFGTYSVNAIPFRRTRAAHTLSPLTMSLIHMPPDPSSRLPIYYAWDHRVLDGLVATRAISELETTLNGEIVAELHALADSRRSLSGRRDRGAATDPRGSGVSE